MRLDVQPNAVGGLDEAWLSCTCRARHAEMLTEHVLQLKATVESWRLGRALRRCTVLVCFSYREGRRASAAKGCIRLFLRSMNVVARFWTKSGSCLPRSPPPTLWPLYPMSLRLSDSGNFARKL